MKSLLSIIFSLLLFSSLSAQEVFDDLKKSLNEEVHDTVKLNKMISTAWNSFRTYPQASLETAKEALILANKLKRYSEEAKCNNMIGTIFNFTGNYDSANFYYNASFNIGKEFKDDLIIAKACSNIGLNLYYQGKYDKALEKFFFALPLYEKFPDSLGIANCYANAGNTYYVMNSLQDALKYFDRALIIFTNINYRQGMANMLNSLGATYSEIDSLSHLARGYYERSLVIKEQLNDRFGISNSLMQIATIWYEEKNYSKALDLYQQALKIKLEIEDKSGITIMYINIGNVHDALSNYDEAFSCFNKALKISEETGNHHDRKHVYSSIAHTYAKMKNFEKAYQYIQLFSAISDSLINEEKLKQISEMQAKYETEKKENEIALLRSESEKKQLLVSKRNWQIAGILFISIALLIAGLLPFTRYRSRQKQLKEIAILQTRQTERMRIARDMHDEIGAGLTKMSILSEQTKMKLHTDESVVYKKLSELSSQSRELTGNLGEIIWTMNPDHDTLSSMFSYVRNFAFDFLENAGLNCTINFPDEIPEYPVTPELRKNVFLVVKESVNNIVKHSGATKVDIQLKLDENSFSLTVSDNGKGLKNACKKNTGNGLINMRKRIEEIKGLYLLEENSPGLSVALKDIPYK